MADSTSNGEHVDDLKSLRRILLSNSTKRRTAELHTLHERIESEGQSILITLLVPAFLRLFQEQLDSLAVTQISQPVTFLQY